MYASHVNYVYMARMFRELNFRPTKVNEVKLEGNKTAVGYTLEKDYQHFDCLTNLRPTISRVVSCWNFRMVQTAPKRWTMPSADQMTPKDWQTMLPYAYDVFSGGCNNEIVRGFSSLNEDAVNTLHLQKNRSDFFFEEFEKLASRMSKCVIFMLNRCEESKVIINHYLPWVDVGTSFCSNHTNNATTPSSMKVLKENATEAILLQNQMDEMLFQLGEVLFEEQLKIASSSSNNSITNATKILR